MNDRKLVQKQFQKHVGQIFESLNKAISDKSFDDFLQVLSESIKNLGVRIKQIDKKIEKKVRDCSQALLRELLTNETFDSPLFDYKKSLSALLNLRLSECGCYLGLPSEEWAIKILTNLIINGHVELDPPLSEKMREDYIQAQNAFIQPLDT